MTARLMEDPHHTKALLAGEHRDPFSVLGMHLTAGEPRPIVRAFVPWAASIGVVDATSGEEVARLQKDPTGLFVGAVEGRSEAFPYRLRITADGRTTEVEDPYRFGLVLGSVDVYLLAEGSHLEAYNVLGAQCRTLEGVAGVSFAVWAPNAWRVSVVGDFNRWDGRVNPMRLRPECGIWEIFIPGLKAGTNYKFEIKGANGHLLPLKVDPYAFCTERLPGTASVVCDCSAYVWGDEQWMGERASRDSHDKPMSIYEVHLGSWKRVPEEGFRYLSYRELADDLVPYVKHMGFTHIELLPITEYPFDGSWGYQPISMFAPTSRFGPPGDFQAFVDRCHREGLGVILDWVPGHFPSDAHGLAWFDGSHLYEHADPRQGRHEEWGTLVYNYGRREVANFLIASALFWLDRYHIDGLRVDAVASMLYLDYSRNPGEWIPNEYGGNENLDAVRFIKRVNEQVYARFPGAMTIAEESTAWPMVSRPTYLGGLGFGYKWNMGWMHDTLRYMSKDPIHRRHHHHDLTFGMLYAFTENFILPLSHDEVVHGKGSLIAKMPGDGAQQFANLRAYFAFMFTFPGKKLLFMGAEFAQGREWNHDASLDWDLLQHPLHRGVHHLIRDLNRAYGRLAPLFEVDFEPHGFEWIVSSDADNSVIAYIRRSGASGGFIVSISNFTPVTRHGYRIGVPSGGCYEEVVNTDAEVYGGGGLGNLGRVWAEQVPSHGLSHSLVLTVPPLASLILAPESLQALR